MDSRFFPAASLSRLTSSVSFLSIKATPIPRDKFSDHQLPLAPPPPLMPPPNPPKPPPPPPPPPIIGPIHHPLPPPPRRLMLLPEPPERESKTTKIMMPITIQMPMPPR